MNKPFPFALSFGAAAFLTAALTIGLPLTAVRAQDAPSTGMDEGGIVVKVGDAPIAFDTARPRMIGGRVMVPVRGVFEKLGGTVQWDPSTQTVKGARQSGDNRFQMQIDKTEAMVDDKTTTLDAPPTLEAGTTYVPLRFVSEALGATVNYDNATRTVSIKPAAEAASASGNGDQTNAPSETITPGTDSSTTPPATTASPPGPAGAASGTTPESGTASSTPPVATMTPATPPRPAPAVNPDSDDTAATNEGGFLRYLPWILGALALAALAAFLLTRKPAGQVIAANKGNETNTTTTTAPRKDNN